MEIKNVIKDDIYKKFIDYAYNKDLILRVTLSNFGLDEKKLETLNLTINKLLNIDPASLIKIVTYDKTMILPSIEIQKMYYSIGNEMVDIIMNYFFGMLPQDVHIELKGRCPVNIDMNDTDMCTVFSNLFQNTFF